MRPYRLVLAVAALILAAGCGGPGGGTSSATGTGANPIVNPPPPPPPPPPPNAPVAKFSASCNLLDCAFSDKSTAASGTVSTYAWDFGEAGSATNTSTVANPTHLYAGAGSYHVTLVVTDDAGVSSPAADSLIIIIQGPSPTSPSANFSFSCAGLNCTIADASFVPDPAVTIVAYDWDFGDGSPHDATPNPSHTYNESSPTTEHVTLTVTDTLGRTFTVTKDVPVAPVGLTCGNGLDDSVSCPMYLPQKATVTVTLRSTSCGAVGNAVRISSPITETIFTNGCYETLGTVYTINGGDAFNPGTLLVLAVNSGVTGSDRTPPAVIVGGTYPSWTIYYDDGGFASYPGEPDFNDLVLTVDVTVVP